MKRLIFSSASGLALLLLGSAPAQTSPQLPAAHPLNPWPASPGPFELRDGDRVALVGDTLIERARHYGYIEQRILAHYPGKNIIFRNLGWSADTPAGQSRASFDWNQPEAVWFKQLTNQIASVRPTVVILGYGMANSFDGAAGLPTFERQLNRLIDAAMEIIHSSRIVLLSPIRHENLGAPLPDPTEHNRNLRLYHDAIRRIALQRNLRFISLFTLPDGTRTKPARPLTDDGIHLNAYGYWRAAEAIERGLGYPPNWWRLGVLSTGDVRVGCYGLTVSGLVRQPGCVRFTGVFGQTVNPLYADPDQPLVAGIRDRRLQVRRLLPGAYTLYIDGKAVETHSAQEWNASILLGKGPPYDLAEELRQAIVKKNDLFFDRWRPENTTYLFGFRKHEQGKNAKEIPMFDPLIDQQDALIAKLNDATSRRFAFEIAPAGSKPRAAESTPEKAPESESARVISSREMAAQKAPLPLPDFELAPGFDISLYAEDPLLAKPIQMNFDPKGRLWVVSSSVYPQIEPGQKADDKVLVLEDTRRRGKADKSTVFADGLLIPTSVVPGDGGAYVGQSAELLFFKDTNGDGKADEKRIVLSAFGTEDTHHIIHTLRWGPDGQLYFNQSIYIHSHIETPRGVVRLNSGGVFNFRPDTMDLGIFLRGFCNPWGHVIDQFGQSFVTDGAGFQGVSYGIRGATYFTYADMRREMRSISPGSYPKFASLEMIRSAQFPPDWQGNLITCDFRAHRVARFALSEQGAGYVTKELPDLVRSQDATFRPIDVKLGPDGALYVADWSNPIIQHGEVDFRDPRRDHWHGRIWRIAAHGRSALPRRDLTRLSNAELLADLDSPNAYDEQQARRVLTERKKNILSDLQAWLKNQTSPRAALEGLWLCQSLDVVETNLLRRVLDAADGRIRAAGVRVLSAWAPRVPLAADWLAEAVRDPHPRVRLEAVRALAKIPTARSAELVLSALDQPMDDFLDYAVWLSINDLSGPWLDALRSGAWNPEGRERQLEFGLQAIPAPMAKTVLGQLLKSHPLAADGQGPWIELIGQAGGPDELQLLFDKVLDNGFQPDAARRALASLASAAQARQTKPAVGLDRLTALLRAASPVQSASVELAGLWKLRSAVAPLVELAGNRALPETLRAAAFNSLRQIGGKEAKTALENFSAESEPLPQRLMAVQSLAALDLNQAVPRAVRIFSEVKDENQALAFWRGLLSVKGAPQRLARGLDRATLTAAAGHAGLRAAREEGRAEPELVMAIARSAQLSSDEQNLSDAEIKKIAADAMATGDAARGEQIFRRADVGCATCHSIGGVGGKVGPDLTSVGASAPPDYLVESVLYPNRKIKEGYHSVLIETKDGEEYSGIPVRENSDKLVIRDAANHEIEIAKNAIAARKMGGSLMPAGLAAALTPRQQADLYKFLAQLGKPGPYDASKGNVARLWFLFTEAVDNGQFGDDRIVRSTFASPGWSPAASLVNGTLPREILIAKSQPNPYRPPLAVYAGARLQVPKPGAVRLHLIGADPLGAWIDGRPIALNHPTSTLQAQLAAGVHAIVLKLDAKNLPDGFQLESGDGTFLTN